MAYNSNLDARGWGMLEPAPSTRDSTSLLHKWYPINTTLATTNVAEDLFTVSHVTATVNMFTNPSFETGDPPTGMTASGATLAQDATYYKYGTKSLKITGDNAAIGEGAYWEIGEIPARISNKIPLSISCYFRDAAGSGKTVRVRLVATNTTPFASGTVNYLNGSTVTLTTGWQRSTLSVELDTTDTYTVYLVTAEKTNQAFYADGLQVETLGTPSDYCDGDQNVYCSWDGTAHASVSRRIKSIGSIRNMTLHTDKDIYICYDGTATSSNGRLLEEDSTMWLDHPVYILKNISIINAVSGELPHVSGELWGV